MVDVTGAGLRGILGEVVEETLDSMFFTGLGGDAEPPTGEPLFGASLKFTGGVHGSCGVWLSRTAAESMTANFLGLEPSEAQPWQVEQVIREFTNMVGGSALSRLSSEWDLVLLAPEYSGESRWPLPLNGASRSFGLDDGFLTVMLSVHLPERA